MGVSHDLVLTADSWWRRSGFLRKVHTLFFLTVSVGVDAEALVAVGQKVYYENTQATLVE